MRQLYTTRLQAKRNRLLCLESCLNSVCRSIFLRFDSQLFPPHSRIACRPTELRSSKAAVRVLTELLIRTMFYGVFARCPTQ